MHPDGSKPLPEDQPLEMLSDDILRIFFSQEHKGIWDTYALGSSRHEGRVSSHAQRGTLLTGHHGCDSSAAQLSTFHTTEPELKAGDQCDVQSRRKRGCPPSTAPDTCADKEANEKRVGFIVPGNVGGEFRTIIFLWYRYLLVGQFSETASAVAILLRGVLLRAQE